MQPEFNLDMSRTYIFEGDEYILTGRVAEKTIETPHRPRRSRRRRVEPIHEAEIDMMVEITPNPKNRSIGNLSSESKWVKYSQLYAVTHQLYDEDDNDESSDSSV